MVTSKHMRRYFGTILLTIAAMLSGWQTTLNAKMNTISIAYGIDGEPAIYMYRIVGHDGARITCELVAGGKTVEREQFEWRSDLHALSCDLLGDFGQTSAKTESATPVPKDHRKTITIVCAGPGAEATVAITGSDAVLTTFIAQSAVIRELFGRVSFGKPKMYRLWEIPNQMGSYLTPLTPKEKAEASRKTNGSR
jgi:hypothetical protein